MLLIGIAAATVDNIINEAVKKTPNIIVDLSMIITIDYPYIYNSKNNLVTYTI